MRATTLSLSRSAARRSLVRLGCAPHPSLTEPDLAAILERHVEAIGGRANLAAIDSLRVSGRVSASGGRHAVVVREIARPGRVRTEFTYQGVTGVYAYDGDIAWEVSPLEGEPHAGRRCRPTRRRTPRGKRISTDRSSTGSPRVTRWSSWGRRARASANSTSSRSRSSGGIRAALLPRRRELPSRAHHRHPGARRDATIEVDTLFSDYRDVGGVQLPHAIETGALDRPQRMSIVVTEVELNPERWTRVVSRCRTSGE